MADLFHTSTLGHVQVIQLDLPDMLDSSEFDRLNESLLSEVAKNPKGGWVLDLTLIHYAGSSLLGLMVNVRQRIKLAGGRLVLCGMSERLMQIFQTCSLERLFDIRRDRDEAVKRVK
jgi:anti-anti-sigma factor